MKTKDNMISGRPIYVSTLENIDYVHDMIVSDYRLELKRISEIVKIT